MNEQKLDDRALRALLHWYVDMGVDVATNAEPTNQFVALAETPIDDVNSAQIDKNTGKKAAKKPKTALVTQIAPSTAPSADEAVVAANEAASKCDTVEALRAAVLAFEGCTLKAGARNTVFDDGNSESDLLVIGEAPGREEDRMGCLLYTSPSPRDLSTSRMPSSA